LRRFQLYGKQKENKVENDFKKQNTIQNVTEYVTEGWYNVGTKMKKYGHRRIILCCILNLKTGMQI